jgi:hypothetical protein
MKKLTLMIILCQLNIVVSAQSPRQFHNISNGWTDVNVSGKLFGKFSWQIENQHRREDEQGDYNESTRTGNIYHDLNQNVFRPYVHYQASPNVRISLMPLGWIGSNRFSNGKPSSFFGEIRVAPQVIFTQNLKKLRIDNRYRYEFRWIGKNMPVEDHTFLYGGDFSTTTYRNRFRYQLKMSRPLNKPKMEDKTIYIQAYDEVFMNIGQKVGNTNLLDQNRVMIGLGYRLNKNFSFEAGFMRQTIYRLNNKDANGVALNNNVDRNNILQLNFAINNFETLFKRKVEVKK